MHKVTGMIAFREQDRQLPILKQNLDEFKLKLDKSVKWRIGMDQSTSCTGMALRDEEGKYTILLDVERDKKYDARDFEQELFRFVNRLLRDQTVTYLIVECPVKSNKVYARDTLVKLRGFIDNWRVVIPELEDTVYDDMFPNVWRSLVMDKSKGSVRERQKSKHEIASDVLRFYPEMEEYFFLREGTTYDSFEAAGILEAYKYYAFSEAGEPMICGTEEKQHHAMVAYKWLKADEIQEKLMGSLAEAPGQFIPTVLAFNPKFSLHENIRKASSKHDFVITLVPREELNPFRWTMGIDPDDESYLMVCYIFRKSYVEDGRKSFLKFEFEELELVTSD